ncbi:GntR family transcriptional regulator [Flindersiella endophytica]
MSVYLQLTGILRARIRRGDWPVGELMASELALSQEYGVARETARRAVRLLAEHGYTRTAPQRGTYVLRDD